MSQNPERITCGCGRGKVSAWDGKCGYCRTNRERLADRRMREGWTREDAALGYKSLVATRIATAFDGVVVDDPEA